MNLNLAAVKTRSKTLGPKERFVFWVQGCNKSCPGCISKKWQENKKNQLVDVRELFKLIWQTNQEKSLEGISISGGEPFLQAQAIAYLSKWIKEYTTLGIILYTGYTHKELVEAEQKSYQKLLDSIDLLIVGPYKKELNDNQGLRGSSNQEFIYLTDRYLPYQKQLEEGEREVEIDIKPKEIFLVGVPGKDTLKSFKSWGGDN